MREHWKLSQTAQDQVMGQPAQVSSDAGRWESPLGRGVTLLGTQWAHARCSPLGGVPWEQGDVCTSLQFG